MNFRHLVGAHKEYHYKKGVVLSSESSVRKVELKISEAILSAKSMPEYEKIAFLSEMYNYYKIQPYFIFVKYLFDFGRYTTKLNDYLEQPYSERLQKILKILERDPSKDKFRHQHVTTFGFLTIFSKRYVIENKHLITKAEYIYINSL